MRYLLIIIASIIFTGCAWFGMQNDSQIPTISAPPQKLNESNAAMPIIPPNNASGAAKAKAASNDSENMQNQQRIQEDRSNGVVDQIKVNNKNLPSYYIYPSQQQNYDVNNIPDQNVVAPNWQISW